jgi:hypothetical protein
MDMTIKVNVCDTEALAVVAVTVREWVPFGVSYEVSCEVAPPPPQAINPKPVSAALMHTTKDRKSVRSCWPHRRNGKVSSVINPSPAIAMLDR